jgi:FAD/FMN-containing dehydrogenase
LGEKAEREKAEREEAAGTFTGRFVERGQPGYEEARVGRVFNGRRPGRFPAAVLMAADDDDVVAGVRWANAMHRPVSVRSGGHSWAAWSVRDDALLIDLGGLRDIGYDPATGIAAVRPAVRGGTELAPYLAARGRAFPGGHCESVGLGGYLLQGGQGWNGRAWGWACENMAGIDAVTAGGRRVHADETENADLFWAARGAGPGFPAVVTTFYLRTHPRPAVMMQDTWTFPVQAAGPLLAWLHGILPELHVTVEPVVAATRLPDVPLGAGVTRPAGPVLLLHTTVMGDYAGQAEKRLAPFDACPLAGRALGHVRGLTSIELENAAQSAQNPPGYRYVVDCTWSDAPAAELAPRLERIWAELPTEHSFSIWYGWAPSRPLPDMAFSVEAQVYLATYVIYTDEADDERYAGWVHSRTRDLARAGCGVYLGDTDFQRRHDRFVSDEAYRRLAEVRATWDPEGRICSYLTGDADGLNRHG